MRIPVIVVGGSYDGEFFEKTRDELEVRKRERVSPYFVDETLTPMSTSVNIERELYILETLNIPNDCLGLNLITANFYRISSMSILDAWDCIFAEYTKRKRR